MSTAEPRITGRAWHTKALCAVAVFAALVGVLSWSVATRTRHVVTRHRIDALPTAVAVGDCPAGHFCDVDGRVRPDVMALLRAAFGPDSIVESDAVVDVVSRRPYLEHVAARPAAGVSVDLISRCVPSAQPVRSVQSTSAPALGPVALRAVVAGNGGCSVVVTLRAAAGVGVPWAEAVTVARAPAALLHP